MLWGVKELFKQFLYSFSGLFPLAFHSNLFALKCLRYSIVAIHPELLHRNYFSYSETVPDKITRPGGHSRSSSLLKIPHCAFAIYF